VNEKRIGLGKQAELAYRTLLLRPRWQPAMIARVLGWSADQVGEVLTSLRDDGLIGQSGDDPDAVRAIEPCIALPALTARRMRAASDIRPRPAAVERFIALHERAAERLNEPTRLESVDDASAVIERMVTKIREEAVFLVPEYSPGSFDFSRPIIEAALRRQARVRSIWGRGVLRQPGASEHARWLASNNIAPHAAGTVPAHVMIMDGVVAVVFNEDGKIRIVRSTSTLDKLCNLADRLWERSVEVREPSWPRVELGASRPRSEVVLQLLADGLTDDAVARRLGCSVRTVRDEVACTMTALDARSRFQAGVRAMQVGLI
jgi:sugar-specific transcriptional regulator TrmB/DNA-binding CsgD family transcriptional regulator